MYSIHISSGTEVIPYLEFLAIRRRLQQLVIFYVHSWKYDWNAFVGDLLLSQMKDAVKATAVKEEWFDGDWHSASNKDAELSVLDTSIIEQLSKKTGKIQIGSQGVFFQFEFKLLPDGILSVEESFEVSEETKQKNSCFFNASKASFADVPPVYPTTNMEKYLHA